MRSDKPVGDGTWAIRTYAGESAEPCGYCGHDLVVAPRRLRWVETKSGLVVCGGCRFTVHQVTVVGRKAAQAGGQAAGRQLEEPGDQLW